EADELAARALRFLALEDVASHEITLVKFHDPAKVGFERRGGVVDVISVERHLRFETQRVSGPQTAWRHTGLDDLFEQQRTFRRRNVDFESIFARIAGARDDRRRSAHFSAR